MKEVPIYLHGKRCGSLQEERDGIYTLLHAQCEAAEGLVRLYAFGGGRSAYLGIMEAKEGRLQLCRRLSRHEREQLPQCIEYCAERELRKEQPKEPEDGILWVQAQDGSLHGFDGHRRYIALPSQLRSHMGLRRIIEGKEYVVFPRGL